MPVSPVVMEQRDVPLKFSDPTKEGLIPAHLNPAEIKHRILEWLGLEVT